MTAAAANVAEAIVRRLADHGVRRIFGVPGGDCSLDVIDAAPRAGIEFVLTRTESAAAIMAAATADLTGTPGVLMTTRGPGLANAVNGIACAALDRSPLLVLSDGQEPEHAHVSHQWFDQAAVLRPLVKAESRLDAADPLAELDALLRTAAAAPAGPVYLELIGGRIRAPPARARRGGGFRPPEAIPCPLRTPRKPWRCSAGAERPVIIAGLQAVERRAAASLRDLAARWNCPVLVTYKAKGAIPDDDPHAVGPFIGGAAEDATLRMADAILLFGADPVEFPPQPWRYAAPVVEATTHAVAPRTWLPAATLVGDLSATAALLAEAVPAGGWTAGRSPRRGAGCGRWPSRPRTAPFSPGRIVAAMAEAVPAGTRIAVDAGAHMLPVMALWPALERMRQPGPAIDEFGTVCGQLLPQQSLNFRPEPQGQGALRPVFGTRPRMRLIFQNRSMATTQGAIMSGASTSNSSRRSSSTSSSRSSGSRASSRIGIISGPASRWLNSGSQAAGPKPTASRNPSAQRSAIISPSASARNNGSRRPASSCSPWMISL